jgi:Tfp pilus assembly protein PilF
LNCFLTVLPAWAAEESAPEIRILELQGTVELLPVGAANWVLTQTNQVLHVSDRLRTHANSRVTLRWSDQSVVPFGELTELEIMPPQDPQSLAGLHLVKGIISFFHRDKPGRIRIITRGAVAGIEGTEFVMAVDESGGAERTTVSVIDGKVALTNAQGPLVLTNGQQGVAEMGKAPVRTPGFIANNILQWCFYYPGVLNVQDLPLTADEQQRLSESLAAYRQGDLLGALAKYSGPAPAASAAERVYYAALLLSVGQAAKTEAALAELGPAGQSDAVQRCANALRELIAAVKREPNPSTLAPQLPTELMAASYYEQSRARGDASLESALELARRATAQSPEFGFAWARVAELEFSFGRTGKALEALNRSLELAPHNAQALALKGFLLAAQNRPREALRWFDQAIAADGALGNAWLGRGLCRIRVGHAAAGREDLLVAAALEPQRALLRSYLGKAFAEAGETERAGHELALARQLDPKDPTSWLYSALLNQQENRINEAITDLEKSQELNNNRSLFRSKLLLDQDEAMRSANLASIYRDAGMTDVSVREAAHAVTYDYANDAAHLFLSDSYNQLRDPTRFNLRYETVWFNELLLANALAPVGGGRLAQNVAEQDYSRLFQADGLGLANSTLLRSDIGAVTELASQYGTYGWSSYAFDLDYYNSRGEEGRVNNDIRDIEWYTTLKQQVTTHDTVMAIIKYEDYHSGDHFQYYDPTNARPNFRFDESQEPIAIGIWHHEWSPGMHSLVLAGRLENEQHFSDLATGQLLLYSDNNGVFYDNSGVLPFDINYHNTLEVYTAEFNQIAQWNRVTVSLGARYQTGTFTADTIMTNHAPFLFANPYDSTNISANFERITGYGYLTVEPIERVWLTGGFSYDDMTYPLNFRYPPVSPGETHRSLFGPKAAAVWQPVPQVALRGIYSRSLGGVSLDESYRLEPTQLAGFPQAFRTLIPESVAGSVEAPEFEVYGAALDLKFPTRTYAGIEFDELESHVHRTIGLFNSMLAPDGSDMPFVGGSTTEVLDSREIAIGGSINQLLPAGFVVGLSYKFDHMELHDDLPDVSSTALPDSVHPTHQFLQGDLSQGGTYVLFNHPSGFFARADAVWYHQHNSGYNPPLPEDDFVQENVYFGWRFFQRRLELMLGIMNLSNQNYHLNPLNAYTELPRERAYLARLNFIF